MFQIYLPDRSIDLQYYTQVDYIMELLWSMICLSLYHLYARASSARTRNGWPPISRRPSASPSIQTPSSTCKSNDCTSTSGSSCWRCTSSCCMTALSMTHTWTLSRAPSSSQARRHLAMRWQS